MLCAGDPLKDWIERPPFASGGGSTTLTLQVIYYVLCDSGAVGSMSIRIRPADLASARDAESIAMLINSYALEPVGGGKPLPLDVRDRLVPALRDTPNALVLLAFADDDVAVGIAVCFVGFSTFRARPLLNIHDLAVLPGYRGSGVGSALLRAAEDYARSHGYCRLTLEVLESNSGARALYRRFGFDDSTVSHFLVKPLEA